MRPEESSRANSAGEWHQSQGGANRHGIPLMTTLPLLMTRPARSLPGLFAFLLTLVWTVTPLRAGEKPIDLEAFGQLVLGQRGEDVLRILGKPGSKGKEENWEAIGQWVQEWKYPAQGLRLNLATAKRGGTQTLLTISASARCGLTTARGIGIGSSESAVRKAYGPLEDKSESKRGETFVAGSIYGGVIFQFKGGKVTEIFIGAAAE